MPKPDQLLIITGLSKVSNAVSQIQGFISFAVDVIDQSQNDKLQKSQKVVI
jgi:hypothetical protein